ncbi:MAG: polysaccharide lyase family 1 protein [Mangrovibacterium sp.]
MLKLNFLFVFLLTGTLTWGQQLAFPGAEGFGSFALGGRGGKVLEVTNLNDHGPGSLRAAVESSGPRTVVFRLSGTIELASMLTVTNPYLTIAGQTAPGDGICLKNFPLHLKETHDVIIRSIRIRPGTGSGLIGSEIDGIELRKSRNVIIDHCAVSWTVDECINSWHDNKNITVQWSLFSEPLHHSIHEKGAHGYGGSLGGKNASYLYNLIAHAPGRNPSVAGNNQSMTENMDFRNNVVFNYGHRSCDGKPGSINFVGNYYKPGPATEKSISRRLVRIDNAGKYGFQSRWFIDGNYIEGYPESAEDNWEHAVEWDRGTSPEVNRHRNPFPVVNTTTIQAREAFALVQEKAGVIVPGRDSHEKRIIRELSGKQPVRGTGVVNTVEEAGGWPELKTKKAPADTDHDGMPDLWEKKNGLDRKDPADGSFDRNKDGYTNLEEYLNSLFLEK